MSIFGADYESADLLTIMEDINMAYYGQRSAFKVKTVDSVNQNIVVTSDGKSFQVSLPNVSEKVHSPICKVRCCCPTMANRLDAILEKKTVKFCCLLSDVQQLDVELISITI